MSIIANYISSASFSIEHDQTVTFGVGRRVKLVGGTTWYGTIESSVYTTLTTITLTTGSDNIDDSLTEVYYGIISGIDEESSMPIHDHDGEGSGGQLDHTTFSNIGTKTHAVIDSSIDLNTTHRGLTDNPHSVDKTDVGLSNVLNTDLTSDVELNTTHRTSDGKDHSDIVLNSSHRINTSNPHSVDKTDVGLSNVPNTNFTITVDNNTTHRNTTTGNPHGVSATEISDFDTEVNNNLNVAANNSSITTISGLVDDNIDAIALNTTHRGLTNNPHTVTKTQVGLNDVPNTDFTTPVSLNTSKITNATHTGEVIGSGALTIVDNIVDEANFKLDEGPTDDYVLTADSTKSGGMKWSTSYSGVTDHGALTGLVDDDHLQYHNDTRGDARYYTQTQTDSEIDTDISTHAALSNAHHNDSHTVVSHSDTTSTGSELDELTGGEDTILHDHDGIDENTIHRSSDGTDHSYIDQDVTSSGNPTFNSVKFDLLPNNGIEEGKLIWNDEAGTLELGLPGGNVVLQIGQEIVIRIKNEEAVTINNGEVVYASTATGNIKYVKLASATNHVHAMKVVGVATEDIEAGSFGYITTTGLVRDFDTSAFSDGQVVYLGTELGELIGSPTEAPNTTVVVGIVVRPHNSEGIMYVNISPVSYLEELSNVSVSGTTVDGDYIYWEDSSSTWNARSFDTTVSGNADVVLNTTHRTSNGSDHTFINQDVTINSSPTFSGTNITGIVASGSDGEIQFNDGGTFGANSNLHWDDINKRLGIGGFIYSDNFRTDEITTHNVNVGNDTGGTGTYSTFIGEHAGENNTGVGSTATGFYALYNNTGVGSTATGYRALYNNTGVGSTATGYRALYNNTGVGSTATGFYALYNNTGSNSTATGYYALNNNTGSNSTATGYYALNNNTGSNSTATGYYALNNNTGANNTAFGNNSFNTWLPDTGNVMDINTTEIDPTNNQVTVTGHGYTIATLLIASTTGTLPNGLSTSIHQWKVIDVNTLKCFTDSFTDVGSGVLTLTPKVTYSNSSAFGYDAEPDASNQVVLGDTNVTQVKSAGSVYFSGSGDSYFGGNVGIGTTSPTTVLDINGDLILEYGTSINEFSTDTTLSGNSDDVVLTEKAIKTYVDNITLPASQISVTDSEDYYTGTNVETILDEIGETRLISGYDLTDEACLPDLVFTDGTRLFEVKVQSAETSFCFWVNSHKYEKTTTHSVTIPDVTDTYYIYFDNSGVLQYVAQGSIVPAVFYENVITGIVYWNATASTSMVGDERHGKLMDGRTHHFNHATFGARYESGLDITGLTDGSPTYTNTTSGFFWDEDIRHSLSLQTTHPFIYKLGATGEWTGTTPDSNVGFNNGTANIVFNEWTGATWQLTESGSSTDYMIYFMIATPDLGGYNVKKIIGQGGYSSRANARAAIESEMDSIIMEGLPSPEFIFLNAYIVRRNGDLEDLADGSTHVDLRSLKGGTATSAGATSIAADVTTSTTNFNTHLSVTDADVQTALETLDDHEHTFSEIVQYELDSDPVDPENGSFVTWMSSGIGYGDAGDICMAITVSGTTKQTILVDFSAI